MSTRDDGLPQDDAGMTLMIHALVDGELDAATALAVERRIAADPALAAEHSRVSAVRKAVSKLPRPPVDDAFMAKIAAIATTDAAQTSPTASYSRISPISRSQARHAPRAWSFRNLNSFDWRAIAASIVVTAVLASGATQWVMVNGASDEFAMAVASGHRRSLLAASPVDVVSSDRHTVKPWLDARLGLSPPTPDLAKDGFSLIGGRVEVIADRAVPALVYRYNEHLITVVAQPRNDGKTAELRNSSTGGFSMVEWSDGAFSYWAISDVERPMLDNFVSRFRAATAAP
ncbi:anti-sigma factor [Mesorhizobium sp. CN2-181]|uniref:anti-sigma factor family protein n=1 Tax=Mesorhizobium yinganensis TaxID=3157707 RepID=UPI0032B781CA